MDEHDDIIPHAQYEIANHCLGQFLRSYVLGKITLNPSIPLPSEVIVRFSSDDDVLDQLSPAIKSGKYFNHVRPKQSVEEHGSAKVFEVICFPGKDYVNHYAHLAKAYMHFKYAAEPKLSSILPSYSECSRAVTKSNLSLMGKTDIVIVGYIERLHRLVTTSWDSPLVEGRALFGWQKKTLPDGRCLSFLGCQCSFWGDISEHLVNALVHLNDAKCIIYIGKAATLRYDVYPNEALATGNSSIWMDEKVVWDNVLHSAIQHQNVSEIKYGNHVTVSSPLNETKTWFSSHKEQCDWVDCEVGYMANSCLRHHIDFAYLHIISDSVAHEYVENLTNERLKSVLEKRAYLFDLVQNVLEHYLQIFVAKETTKKLQ